MVSYSHNTLSSMYQKNHTNNLAYAAPHWYPGNYPPLPSTAHHTTNGQYLPGSGNGNLIGSGMMDSDAAVAYYNQHSHLHSHHLHPMFHQSSPDWTAHDNYGPPQNSTISMGPSSLAVGSNANTATNFLAQLNSQCGHDGDGSENDNNNIDLTMSNHVPPSPPNTVNSGGSQMSSPTMPNSSGGGGGNGGNGFNDSASSQNSNTAIRSANKSPYEWMKKATYQTLPAPG